MRYPLLICAFAAVFSLQPDLVRAAAEPDMTAEYLELLRIQVDGLEGPLPLADEPAIQTCDPERQPSTRGLFIGAAEWTGDAEYHLQGPVNDAELVRNALIARGAAASNLTVLQGAGATRQGLTEAAATLVKATGCGDSVLLHASGWVFSADQLAPTTDPRGPFIWGEAETTLAEMAGTDLGVNAARAVVAQGPYLMLNADTQGVSDVLNADALSDLVTRLRNRGADVTVVLDTSTAEEMRLEERQARVDGRARWRSRLGPMGALPDTALPLGPLAGALTVYYGTAAGELTVEMNLPRGSSDARYYGVFSFRFASALLKAERTTPSAVSRRMVEEDGDGQVNRQWTYVFSTTDPERELIVETRPPQPETGDQIRIIAPKPTRAATALDTSKVTLRGVVEAAADTMIVTVNGQQATSAPDGSFSHDIELQAGVNRIDVLAMTRDNKPLTHSFELFYEGDMQALAGDGTRYALIIANQSYSAGSGLATLATPLGDAQAVTDVLMQRFGYVTTAKRADGSPIDLFLKDATRVQIETALFELGQIAGAKDSVLIFYAGHGIYEQATDGAFWLPADASADRPFTWLPAAAISDAILRIEAGNVLVISDSCYSGALLRGNDIAPTAVDDADRLRSLQRLASKRSRIVIASGGNEPVADGGGDGHSVFARALIQGLSEMPQEAFTARELFDQYLLPMVTARAAQEPQYRPIERSGHEGGDVVLVRAEASDL